MIMLINSDINMQNQAIINNNFQFMLNHFKNFMIKSNRVLGDTPNF